MKPLLLIIAGFLSKMWLLFPVSFRRGLITGLFVLDSRERDPAKGLRQLLLLKDRLDWVINERAMAYGRGVHPKHRLTNYHLFFIERINDGERVLDVGCGYGAVARSIARARPLSMVVGIDLNASRLALARAADNPKNLTFVSGDARLSVPSGAWDVIVLSNVLEHLENRSDFLTNLKQVSEASRYLIRVPLFERDWQMPLRRELGVNYFSDNDHKVEHTLEEFTMELKAAGLHIAEKYTLWGEIWADCRPVFGREK